MNVVNDVVEELCRVKIGQIAPYRLDLVAVLPLDVHLGDGIHGPMQLKLRPEKLGELFALVRRAQFLKVVIRAVHRPPVRLDLKRLDMKPKAEALELGDSLSDRFL